MNKSDYFSSFSKLRVPENKTCPQSLNVAIHSDKVVCLVVCNVILL